MIFENKLLVAAFVSVALAVGCAAEDASSGDETAQDEGELGLRKGSVDQAAVVESTTMQLAGGPTDGLLDQYNEEDPFAIHSATYAGRFDQRLGQFDGIDGKTDWQPAQKQAWVSRMSSGNYLVLDTSKPCGDFNAPHTYLEIERAALTGKDHATCGGRMPNEDALDVTANFLVRGPSASVSDQNAIHDGVEQATQKSVPTFPYLAEMNGL